MASKSSSKGKGEEARLLTILNSMVEAVFVTDPKGRVTLTNEALDDLIARDVRGRRAKNVIKNKDLKVAIRRARKKNEATDVELEHEIGDRLRSFHAQVAPLPDNAGVVTVLHDVTSLKDADRIRRDFVANASHELRTPLTAIRGFAETLRDGALEDPAAGARFVEAILRHTVRLQRLAEDLTGLAQAESPQHGYEEALIDVRAVCAESASSLEPYARRKQVVVRLEMPDDAVVVELSARALEHVLINLVENAIKYSPMGTDVVVRVEPSEDHVGIEVCDEGVGIPEEAQERIFERFYRVDEGRSRDEGGTGLGLSIARNHVERMGGTLEVESAPGEGSCFRVVLPLDAGDDVELD
ncbi:MAG TPA: ATP-binding protein [Sandaracinaceae bacterium LLY-WYZ-13_1]|nr:ATP-binding protein [Sandaracinaceae bacterium LLY-WYZ-13_1]